MFKFKGISSTDMQVVIEEEEHFIARASKRYETIEIEGKDGAIFNELGYSYVERPIYVQCLNIDKMDDILAWLDGEGEFEYKGRKTIARFYSQLEPQREGYIRIIDTTFIRDPFWVKANEEFVTVKESKYTQPETSKSIYIEDASTIGQLEVLGNQEQETREGYNIFDYLGNIINSIGGLTVQTQNDGYIIVNGTPTHNHVGITKGMSITDLLEDNQTYTLWQENYAGYLRGLYVQITANPLSDSGASTQRFFPTTQKVTFTVDKSKYTYNVSIQTGTMSNTGTFTNYKNRYMIYKGTENKEFELYGVMPSPNYPSPVKCLGSNKQLFNKDDTINTLSAYIDGTGNIQYNTLNKAFYIKCPKNTDITVSGKELRGIACYNQVPTYNLTSSVKNINQSSSLTINTGDNTYLLVWYYENKSGYTGQEIIDSIKVEEGTEATSYSPYGQGSTEIKISNEDETEEISKILHIQQEMLSGDYFIKEDDGWKEVHNWKKYVFTGSESRWSNTFGTNLFCIQHFLTDIKQTGDRALCNYFKFNAVQSGINNTTSNGEFAIQFKTENEIGNIFFKNETFSNVDDWKNWLQEKYDEGNPLYVFYELQTPTKLPCTPEQTTVLEELNNLELFEGVNNIITTEDIALLKLNYMKYTDEKINNEGNKESRPILRLEKSSTDSVELTINNCRFNYNFNGEEYVEIDCEEKEVKYEGLNRNRQIEIGYDFPILNIGNNDIKMHSGDCVIKVLRKDRWL